MNSRERMLAIAVGAVLALFGLKWGFDYVSEMFEARDNTIADRTAKVAKMESTIREGAAAEKRIDQWEQRSLPTNVQVGPAKYQYWLTDLVNKHLDAPTVERGTVTRPGAGERTLNKEKPLFEKYGFHIKAESDLKMTKLVEFLYDFYAANHLQKIRNLSIIPDNNKLSITIDIEAMMLTSAERKEDLASAKLKSLALGDLAAYQKVIGNRDLFELYKAPPPRGGERPAAAPFDVAKYTKVTGIKSVNGEPEMDINVRPTGQQFRGLKEGSDFTVGGTTYKVVQIGSFDAVLMVDGKRKQIHLGDMLQDAVSIPETETGL